LILQKKKEKRENLLLLGIFASLLFMLLLGVGNFEKKNWVFIFHPPRANVSI
jgi:hypothetical protein